MARPKKEQAQAYTVIAPFQDAREYVTEGSGQPRQYNVGDDVSHFDETRLALAIERGLVSGGPAQSNEAEDAE